MANILKVIKSDDSISIVTIEFGVLNIEKDSHPRDYEEIYNSIKAGDEIEIGIDPETSERTIVINDKLCKF